LEKHHGVALDDDALRAAVEWSVRYLPDFRLPDKALDLVDQACAAVRFRTLTPQPLIEEKNPGGTPGSRPAARRNSYAGRGSYLRVGREEIAGVAAARCGIPVGTLTADEGERLKRLEELLSGRVKGQPEAIAAVADAVRLARAAVMFRTLTPAGDVAGGETPKTVRLRVFQPQWERSGHRGTVFFQSFLKWTG